MGVSLTRSHPKNARHPFRNAGELPALSFMIYKKRHGNARRMFLIYSEAHEIQLPRLSVGSLSTLAAPPTLLSLDIPPPLTRRLLLVLTAAHPSHSLSPPCEDLTQDGPASGEKEGKGMEDVVRSDPGRFVSCTREDLRPK